MHEQPKREWLTGAKRQWSTPKMREIPVTEEILAHFKGLEATPLTDEKPAKKTAARR